MVTTTFSKEHPDISDLMKHVSFTNAQMGGLLSWQDANKASAEETAVRFITTESAVWSKWVNDAARKKLAGLIK